ncbi:uncharacterized protein LOC105161846 isoform X2 [Sesamum indicum]|uniref:Uncharacterized protein LOC105161846 isoform X2 n=1 Tax=Sesamum indicum TaxID=4182 RepID=A0A6I9T4P2_SESIN|nr:uncharacterized protein LOC105161846 isoform X2 [Sesamum indicum]
MPGTIQVTVLEFKGVSSSSKPSAKSLKVSMGKRHYQTWDKGEFSFPITKLRENLVVAILDAGGNEIAHADIRTMQIIEKGSWDEVFSINGGGHVHMKLQFILSEEERKRIRSVRESAVKKKLESNPNINLRLTESTSCTYGSVETSREIEQKVSDSQEGIVHIDVVSPKVEASQAGLSLNSATSSAISAYKEGGGIIKPAFPDTTDQSQGAPSSPQLHEQVPDEKSKMRPLADIRSDVHQWASSELLESAISGKRNLVVSKLQDDPIQESRNQEPVEKTPSIVRKISVASKFKDDSVQKTGNQEPSVKTPSNVRKMISAFENGQLQERKSMRKSLSLPSELNRFRKAGQVDNRESKELTSTVTPIPSGSGAASREPTVKELEISVVDLMRQSTSKAATSSGRMPEEQSQVTQSSNLLKSSQSSVAEGSGRGRGTGLKSSKIIDIKVASNPKLKSLEYYNDECYSTQSSGMWIFPDNARRLCITTAGKQVIKIVGHQHSEAKTREASKGSSALEMPDKNQIHGKGRKNEKNQKKYAKHPARGRGSSPDDSSNGLVGQVIKVAVILAFGALVFLTRQKEPRKKNREGNDNLLSIPDYIDERSFKPWLHQQ